MDINKSVVDKSLEDQEGEQVTISELLDGSTFFAQNAKDQQVKQMSDILAGLNIQDMQPAL